MHDMPNQDGTGPAEKGSGTGRKRGTCGMRKSGSSGCVNSDLSGSKKNNKQKDGSESIVALGNRISKDKCEKRRFGKTSEFLNPEWWK
jgi:hypothetical protein